MKGFGVVVGVCGDGLCGPGGVAGALHGLGMPGFLIEVPEGARVWIARPWPCCVSVWWGFGGLSPPAWAQSGPAMVPALGISCLR